jgi:signal transduction histidine kinase/predicted negative regulator of RcsB-dependent stress response
MALGDWLRPPRHLVILFLGIALVLVCTLAWLGWRLFDQDRALEEQRVQVRLEHAADVVAGAFTRRFRAVDDRLAELVDLPAAELASAAGQFADSFSQHAVLLIVTDDALRVYPDRRLLYHPIVPLSAEPDTRVFAAGEAFEFRQRNLSEAIRAYRRLAQSPDTAIRAGALLRLARSERKAGRFDAALDTYDALAALVRVSVGGLPADLVARHARLSVLERLSRADELEHEATALVAGLCNARWRLTRAQHEYYSADLCQWIDCAGAELAPGSAEHAIAAAAEWVWDSRDTLRGEGREVRSYRDRPVLVVWHAGDRTVALVGGAAHIDSDWIAPLEPSFQRQNITVALSGVNGTPLTAPQAREPVLMAARSVADTRLPWVLQVASADASADFAELRERRRLMLLGLGTLVAFVLVGLYAVTRGVNRELEVARLQSDFVAAVSHEFRTPLTSLRQLAELSSSGRVASEDRRAQYYGIMERETARLHRLVEGLLDFGRMEAGAMEFSRERVNSADLVQSIVRDFEVELGERGHRVELRTDETAPAITGDPEALRRAIWNLLDNAVKYSPDAGAVRVSVGHEVGQVAITVSDDGCGISPDDQGAIFGKFVRGSGPDGRAVKGTGIGLAMVKHIVEAHGGDVQVQSAEGQGSTFTILLPAEE